MTIDSPPQPSSLIDLIADPERLEALRGYDVSDIEVDEVFERFTELAFAIFGAPVTAISFIDSEREWFKASRGLTVPQLPLANSIGAHAIGYDALVVPDLLLDSRFGNCPLAYQQGIRFYAAAVICSNGGKHINRLRDGLPAG